MRKYDEGVIVDTGVSADDFLVVSTTPATPVGNNATPLLGAPGPAEQGKPQRSRFVRAGHVRARTARHAGGGGLARPTACGGSARRWTRWSRSATRRGRSSGRSLSGAGSPTTRARPVSRLRFRIYDLTTFPQPAGTADLRALSSGQLTGVTLTGGATVTVEGTTLDNSGGAASGRRGELQPGGGHRHGRRTQLAHGASINLQFLFGVQQTGSYRLGVLIEALPGAGRQDLWILTGDTEAGGDAEQACAPTPTNISGTKVGRRRQLQRRRHDHLYRRADQ